MGKETKIGLAVIGVLLAVFGVLLFRQLGAGRSIAPIEDDTAVATRPLTSEGMSDPQSVPVSSEDAPAAGARATWDEPADSVAAVVEEPPAGSYLPEEAAPSHVAADPYAEPLAAATAPETDASSIPATANPHRNPHRNPLRRASVELPLENTAAADAPTEDAAETIPDYEGESAADLAAVPSDPYADEAPVRAADPFDDEPRAQAPSFGRAQPAAPPETAAPEYDALPAQGEAYQDAQPQDNYPPDAYQDEFTGRAPEAGAPPAQANDPFEAVPRSTPQAVPADDAWADDYQRAAAPQPRAGARVVAAPQPAALPQPAVAPPVVTGGKYTVQPGDTLWSISEKVYGTGGYFKALAARNRAILPRSDQLTVGGQVSVPPADELERDFPSLCPKQRKSALVQPGAVARPSAGRSGADVYVVAEGDTLFDIARYELGRASRWAEIYNLNRDVLGEDFDYLRPGTELVMPPRGGRAAEVSQASGSRYE